MAISKLLKTGTGSPALAGLAVGLLLAALTLLVAMMRIGPATLSHRAAPMPASRATVAPPDVVPQVEPAEFQALAPADARTFNASVPFSTAPNPAARPFAFAGSDEDRLRALDCLAAAVLYEAGDDPEGQRAVAQVVLNRVRHPAFPRTVCGVVFQGSERRIGCQFTFTCDGALARAYSEALWTRARAVASAALSGTVYKPVGQATHYHTDWVVPYWSASLDKIVAVHSHLFFRWSGWWGTPAAFRFRATGQEPRIPQLSIRFPEHGFSIAPEAVGEAAPGLTTASISNQGFKPSSDSPDTYLVVLSPGQAANFAQIAASACAARPRCKFMGWTDPAKLPQSASSKLSPDQLGALSFSYLRDRSINLERALWNCAQFKRPAGQCLWSKSPAPVAKPTAAAPIPSVAAPVILKGVRFKDSQGLPAKP
ncbi:cell wall hydrolase [Novosphingobium sp. 9U]|uniref:cell wall hydrolase n=1 Tax=Novosphingobium sp. 9U TaxID=2653158 RepID=UPI0012F2679C|nr:cell wall hydrolase [Novosphingobium sp. 9U]VWX52857.1 Cell wall hydrolase [Novosphingobium sp. 9U]